MRSTPAYAVFGALTLSLGTLAWSCSSNAAPAQPVASPSEFVSNAQIWMHPIPAGAGPPPTHYGSPDYQALFQSDAQWPQVVAHTSVFGMYAGWVVSVDSSDFAQSIAFLNAHHMSIELEAPSLQATATCGSGVEGFVSYNGPSLHDFTLTYLQRLKAAGADLRYIKVDEPFFFGSVVPDPPSCHWTAAQVAQAVGQYAQLVRTVYPNAQVGDVEPISPGFYPTDPLSALTQWHDAYKAATGSDFPFYIADIDFSNPTWPSLVKAIETSTHRRGMQFGIIYIGDPGDSSDQVWSSKVISRFETYQRTTGATPDFVLFQSWLPHPTHCLPERDPLTMTGVVDAYLKATGAIAP
jgi:hypothetical protein